MEIYSAKINHFIIRSGIKGKSFCKVFATKPRPDKEKILGKLFGLIEIKSSSQTAAKLTDNIIEQIKTNYYYQKNPTVDIEEMFEKALNKTNLALAESIQTNKLKATLKNSNIIIAILKNQDLYLTSLGNLMAYLIYYQQKDHYRLLNILEQAGAANHQEINPLKLFSSTIAGKINSLDFLFLATPNILNYLSLEQVKNIITTNPFTDIAKEFKIILSSLGVQELFAALTISIEPLREEITAQPVLKEFDFTEAAAEDSMHELMDTERATQKLLSPSIVSGVKKYSEHFKGMFSRYVKKVKHFPRPKRAIPAKTQKAKKIIQKTTTLSLALIYKIKKTFLKLVAGSGTKNLKGIIKILFNWLITKFKKLPRLSKLILILFIILVILLTQSIIRANLKKRREIETKNFNQIITEVSQKKDAALASLIYQDEKNARLMLTQAKELIKTLPKKFANQPAVIKLTEEIVQELIKLRHEVKLTDPIMIANFKNLDSNMTPAPIALRINNDFYTQNHNNQTIYRLNLESKIITAIHLPAAETGNFITGTVFSREEILFLNETQSWFSFNPLNNKLELISLPLAPETKITALAVFNNRVYLLDPVNNQISRLRKTTNGFSQPHQWLNDNTVDLKAAADFTVDGNIYVLNNNGVIIKLTKGSRAKFSSPLIDPPLAGPTKIKTTENSDYLYILDPPTQRLVVIDKESQLVNQYTSDIFDDLKDFVVLESEAKIYILNGSSVYGLPAQHLE